MEPVSPALAGRFSTTDHQGSSTTCLVFVCFFKTFYFVLDIANLLAKEMATHSSILA